MSYLFLENLEPNIESNKWNCHESECSSVCMNEFFHRFSKEISKCDEYRTPECRPHKSCPNKRDKFHTKNPCRNRNQLANSGYESSDKSVEKCIFLKECFRFFVFIFWNKYIFSVFFEERSPKPATENIVVEKCSKYRAKSTDKCGNKWVNVPIKSRNSSRNHNYLWWKGKYWWFYCHQDKNCRIVNGSKKL